jgi:hypothetical protein
MNQYKFVIEFFTQRDTVVITARGLDTAWKQAAKLAVDYAKATKRTPTAIIFEGAI